MRLRDVAATRRADATARHTLGCRWFGRQAREAVFAVIRQRVSDGAPAVKSGGPMPLRARPFRLLSPGILPTPLFAAATRRPAHAQL